MLILGVDTAEPLGGVSLFQEDVLDVERMMETPLKHAERLIPLIDTILEEAGKSPKDITRIAVNIGPGSFTGLRIGAASAMGLSQALDVPLVGVDGSIAYRQRAVEAPRVCVIVRSRRDLVYVRWFVGAKPKGPIELLHEGELIDRLTGEGRELVLVGSAAQAIHAHVADHPLILLGGEAARHPSPLEIARIGASMETSDRLNSVEPIYVEPILA